MKKIISVLSAVVIAFSFFSFNVYAENNENAVDVFIDYNSNIVHGLYDTDDNANIGTQASDLITDRKLTLAKSGNILILYAKTIGTSEVTKCGFTYIKVQRLINNTWTDFSTFCYKDQYADSNVKEFSANVYGPKGYTYRAICEHYAEKKILLSIKSKQTAYNATTAMYFQ